MIKVSNYVSIAHYAFQRNPNILLNSRNRPCASSILATGCLHTHSKYSDLAYAAANPTDASRSRSIKQLYMWVNNHFITRPAPSLWAGFVFGAAFFYYFFFFFYIFSFFYIIIFYIFLFFFCILIIYISFLYSFTRQGLIWPVLRLMLWLCTAPKEGAVRVGEHGGMLADAVRDAFTPTKPALMSW